MGRTLVIFALATLAVISAPWPWIPKVCAIGGLAYAIQSAVSLVDSLFRPRPPEPPAPAKP